MFTPIGWHDDFAIRKPKMLCHCNVRKDIHFIIHLGNSHLNPSKLSFHQYFCLIMGSVSLDVLNQKFITVLLCKVVTKNKSLFYFLQFTSVFIGHVILYWSGTKAHLTIKWKGYAKLYITISEKPEQLYLEKFQVFCNKMTPIMTLCVI